MAKSKKNSLERRTFLKSAAAGAAAIAATPLLAQAQQPEAPRNATMAALRESEPDEPGAVNVLTTDRTGSDFMVDAIKSLGFEYVCSNPGSSFRGLHESLINYGGNKSPEFITCCHEESAVGMAHGYAKIEGKPLLVMAHSTVGLQHASMAIYNAYCDRVPVYVIVGNTIDATKRRPGVEWNHSAQDAAALVRDFVKWDDLPISLPHFAESAVRAYKIAMTPPSMPVLLVADSELQEQPIASGASPAIPALSLAAPPQGDSGAVAEAARLLVAAENPVIVVNRYSRTTAGLERLVELAEALQAPVVDLHGRMNFPSRHPLNHSQRGRAAITGADVILALEVEEIWGELHSFRDQLERTSRPTAKSGMKLITVSSEDLYLKSNYQDFQRYQPADVAMAADAEATAPALTEAVKRLANADRKQVFQDRGAKLKTVHEQAQERARQEAAYGWDASPISTARVSAELWAAIKDEDWSLVSDPNFFSNWPHRLWDFTKHYQYNGGAGGAGVGYGAPAAVGAALANRKYGRLTVNIQNDGDLMYAPGVLWTAAHSRIPLLSIMHNNHAYHQEVMHIQRMGNRHNRGVTRAGIGTTLTDPNIDFATLAKGLGVHGEGPINDPKDLGPAIRRAVEVAKAGEPALVDVVTQPR